MNAPIIPDDADELAAISTTIRPIVDAGKGRALTLEIVRLMLVAFSPGDEPLLARRNGMAWLFAAVHALNLWHARALDIDTGRENERHPAERLTLLHIAGVADRIVSQAWCQARTGQPIPLERWIVFDLATALRRACECDSLPEGVLRVLERCVGIPDPPPWEKHQAEQARAHHEHTAAALLPLLIRDLRRLCTSARIDPAPIEAAIAGAIAAHGGTPS